MTEEDLYASFRERCEELGLSVEEALEEKAAELEARVFLLSLPNETLREAQYPAYLRQLGRKPTPELLERITSARRGPQLSAIEVMRLEEGQGLRCALCGVILDSNARPHVDHVIPVALGGKSIFENYQLLCYKCNAGKGHLLGWVLGVPYQTRSLTLRLRYCVLAKAQSKCEHLRCTETAYTSELQVVQRVAGAQGGQMIFDNLTVQCARHAREESDRVRKNAVNSIKLKKVSQIFGLRLQSR